MYRLAIMVQIIGLALLSACASAPASQSTLTQPPLPAVTEFSPTATTDPLMATLEMPTIPPLAEYTSSAFGFRFRYPVTSSIEEMAGGRLIWVDKQVSIAVSDSNPEAQVDAGETVESADSTFVNGVSARRLSGTTGAVAGGTPQRYERIIIARSPRFYAITVYELRSDVRLPDRTPSSIPLPAQDLFNTVLATFTLAG